MEISNKQKEYWAMLKPPG